MLFSLQNVIITKIIRYEAYQLENKTIGERIADLRKERNLQQDEFADRIGVSRQALSLWETGKQIPRADKILEICAQFGVRAAYFYGEEEPSAEAAVEGETIEKPSIEEPQKEEQTQTDDKKKSRFSLAKLITLENAYGIWSLAFGWLLASLCLAVVLAIFIIQISPNVNGTTVRFWLIDWTAAIVALSFFTAFLFVGQILRTLIFILKRGKHKDEKK